MKKVILVLGVLLVLFSIFSCNKEVKVMDETQYKEDINNKMQNFSCELNNNQVFELYDRKNNIFHFNVLPVLYILLFFSC